MAASVPEEHGGCLVKNLTPCAVLMGGWLRASGRPSGPSWNTPARQAGGLRSDSQRRSP
jgi:hypothetical protein